MLRILMVSCCFCQCTFFLYPEETNSSARSPCITAGLIYLFGLLALCEGTVWLSAIIISACNYTNTSLACHSIFYICQNSTRCSDRGGLKHGSFKDLWCKVKLIYLTWNSQFLSSQTSPMLETMFRCNLNMSWMKIDRPSSPSHARNSTKWEWIFLPW